MREVMKITLVRAHKSDCKPGLADSSYGAIGREINELRQHAMQSVCLY